MADRINADPANDNRTVLIGQPKLGFHSQTTQAQQRTTNIEPFDQECEHINIVIPIEEEDLPLPATPNVVSKERYFCAHGHNFKTEWCPGGFQEQTQNDGELLHRGGGIRLTHLEGKPIKLLVVGSSYPYADFSHAEPVSFTRGTAVHFGCRPPTGNRVRFGFHLLRDGALPPIVKLTPPNPLCDTAIDTLNTDHAICDCTLDVRRNPDDAPTLVKFNSTFTTLATPDFMHAHGLPSGEGPPPQLTGIHPEAFEAALAYMYGRDPPERILSKHSEDLIKFSNKWDLQNLKVLSEYYYAGTARLDKSNVLDYLQFSIDYNCPYLEEVVIDYLMELDPTAVTEHVTHLGETIGRYSAALLLPFLHAVGRFHIVSKENNIDPAYGWRDARITTIRWELGRRGSKEIDGTRRSLEKALEAATNKRKRASDDVFHNSVLGGEGGTGSDGNLSGDSDESVASHDN